MSVKKQNPIAPTKFPQRSTSKPPNASVSKRKRTDIPSDLPRKQSTEDRLRKLNRIYALLSDVNQTIVRVREPQALFEAACRIAVEQGGFRMAWIGLLDPQTKQVRPAAHAGETDGYLEKLNITLDDSKSGRGPTATALRTGSHVVVNDIASAPRMVPWRADALRLGYRASAAFPLTVAGQVRGTLSLYAPEPNFFDDDELKLLDEMVADIAFALEFAEQEEQRKRAEDEVRKSEEHYRSTLDQMLEGCQILGYDWRYLYLNAAAEKHNNRPNVELLGKKYMDMWPGIEATEVFMVIQRCMEERIAHQMDNEFIFPDGTKGWFSLSIQPIPQGVFILSVDITERKRAEEQIQRQVETLGALYDLSRTLSEMEDFNAILNLLTRNAVETIHVTFARVLLLEQDDLVVRSAFPVRALDHDLQVGKREPLAAHPLCQRILDENTPLILQAGSPEAGDCAPFFLDIVQTLCVIPLRARERPLGLLMLGETRDAAREPFTANKMHLARSIGDQAASTLHRTLLHEETQRRLQNIQALHAIDQAISGSLDLRLTLSIALEQIVNQLNVDAAAVLLLNPHTQTLEYAAGRGFRSKAIERSHLRLGEGHAGRVALEQRLISVHDLRKEIKTFVRADLLAGEEFDCYHGVPLITKGQIKGVLEVFLRSHCTVDAEWLHFLETLAGQVAIAVDNASLFADLQHSNTELFNAFDSTIEGWSRALDLRDKETENHTQRVTDMTLKVARAAGITEAELVHVRRGALLHDIGKMGVPDNILLKPDKLTDEEWVAMRKHPTFAFELLSPIAFLHSALDIPYCHHEKWDGSGYPRGLKGEQIPLAARLFAVVDVWDALRSDRPYRAAWPEEKVREHIRSLAGTHFDPKAVELFLKMMNENTKRAG
jgi:PAS domain S-box-containing protein/putative nucleotidyltransferase with HDIG domain